MNSLPFGREGRFYRGNLHTHSTRSDGRLPPCAVAAAYRDAGYDFLVLSDHFTERYGWPITDTRDARRAGFTTLIGAELHAPRTALGELWHIKAVGLPLDFAPNAAAESGPELARRAADTGAFVGIAHPSWYGLTPADARTIAVAHAVEVYNHGNAIEFDRGNDWPFCDLLLNEDWRLNGYASDDAHFWEDDQFGGWVQVHAERGEPQALLDALKAGRFYSSQGPEIHDLEVDGEALHVRCSPAQRVAVTGRGSRSVSHRGSDVTRCTISLERFASSYFRVTVIDEAGRRAWSNPVWRE